MSILSLFKLFWDLNPSFLLSNSLQTLICDVGFHERRGILMFRNVLCGGSYVICGRRMFVKLALSHLVRKRDSVRSQSREITNFAEKV